MKGATSSIDHALMRNLCLFFQQRGHQREKCRWGYVDNLMIYLQIEN